MITKAIIFLKEEEIILEEGKEPKGEGPELNRLIEVLRQAPPRLTSGPWGEVSEILYQLAQLELEDLEVYAVNTPDPEEDLNGIIIY